MIRPPGFRGAAFGTAVDGDARRDLDARRRISQALHISEEWAFSHQVHGADVLEVEAPGVHGEADALYTTTPLLPVAVKTADCVPIILEGERVVAAVHAGWRGLAAGVIDSCLARVAAAGLVVERAALGPAIGPCCYEVGAEVAARFPAATARTDWGGVSIDLSAAAADRLGDVEVWRADLCTHCGAGFHSHRRDGTDLRQVAVGWLPTA